MSKYDLETRTTIENILENNFSGQCLKNYFESLPERRLRRAISILSGIYPDRTTISDDDFIFIIDMFSNLKFMGQNSFPDFVRAVNILDFTGPQKRRLIDAIKERIEILCGQCTHELDALLVSLFEPDELLRYLALLAEHENEAVRQLVPRMFRYEKLPGGPSA